VPRATLGAVRAYSKPHIQLIPPIYVKPFIKRQKNNTADAAAIAAAPWRPNIRDDAVKSAAIGCREVALCIRRRLVRRRSQFINTLRGYRAELGVVMLKFSRVSV
jgi:transposase